MHIVEFTSNGVTCVKRSLFVYVPGCSFRLLSLNAGINDNLIIQFIYIAPKSRSLMALYNIGLNSLKRGNIVTMNTKCVFKTT